MGGGDDVSGNGAPPPAAHLFPFPHPAARVIPPPTLGGGGTPTSQESIVRRAESPTGTENVWNSAYRAYLRVFANGHSVCVSRISGLYVRSAGMVLYYGFGISYVLGDCTESHCCSLAQIFYPSF